MSVYSSDPFVWEKEQAGRAGQRPPVFWSQIFTNLSVVQSTSVCLSPPRENM